MFGGFAARESPEGQPMSNESAEKRQAFERWVSALRTKPGASPGVGEDESGVTSLDDQKTLVRHLPKDVVRTLREREAGRHLPVDEDSTAIFHPPPELIARARRLVPPQKPERSAPPSAPPDPVTERLPLPVVTAPLPADAVELPELAQPPLPPLADATEWEEDAPAVMPAAHGPAVAPPMAPASEPRRTGWFAWTVVLLGAAMMAAAAWFELTR
jgi:hypothetical protein